MIFVCRKIILLAIDRAAGRSEDHSPQPFLASSYHQVQKPADIYFSIEGRLGDRLAHIHLGCEVHQYLGTFPVNNQTNLVSITDVGVVKSDVWMKLFTFARGKIIHHGDIVRVRRHERIDGMRANKTGTAAH